MSDDDFYDNLINQIVKDWRKYEDVLVNDIYLPIHFLNENLDGFTQFLVENPTLLNEQIVDNLFLTYASRKPTVQEYYCILRILPLIIKRDYCDFTLFDPDFFDEQFVRIAYEADPRIFDYLSNVQQLYVSDNFFAKQICKLIKIYKTFIASLGV